MSSAHARAWLWNPDPKKRRRNRRWLMVVYALFSVGLLYMVLEMARQSA